MAPYINISTAISALDTPSSLLPFFVKDSFDITGRTLMANGEGGKHEAREKFIEEAGTSFFWIAGIPATRWIANKIYQKKIDSNIQFKRINTEGVQNYFVDQLEVSAKNATYNNAPKNTQKKFSVEDLKGIELGGEKISKVKQKLSDAGFKPNLSKGFYKKYHLGVTATAVLVNLFMLSVAIPQLNQFLSRKIIASETKNKKNNNNPENKISTGSTEFEGNNKIENMKPEKTNKGVSFGSLKDLMDFKSLLNFSEMAEKAQLNPVNGMLLLDYGISGSRVTITPRNNNERLENAIKEGGIIFFFYYAGDVIKNKLANFANKVLKTPIDLDYKVLNSNKFIDKLKQPHDKDALLNFIELEKDDANAELKVIKMIDAELASSTKNSKPEELFKNFTLQMAHKEGLIDVEYDSQLKKFVRHSEKYIQTDKIIDLNKNLKTFYDQSLEYLNNSANANKTIENFISKVKKVKVGSIIGNIAICCASLSFIVPKIQYLIREHRTSTKSAPGIKMYQDLAAENKLVV